MIKQPVTQELTTPGAAAAFVMVLRVTPGREDTVVGLLSNLVSLRRSVAARARDARLTCVVGVGSQAWDRLLRGPRPAHLHEFEAITGPRHRAVSTQGDLFVHIKADRIDLCFELATLIHAHLDGACTVVDEVQGFRYFDQRDLLGFVDGTENPEGLQIGTIATVGEEDPRFAGGSYLLVQKYVHDLAAWSELTVEEQERVVGRTKLNNVELPEEAQPPDSHVSLTSIESDDATALEIVRDNIAFGSPAGNVFGTYFIGYARDPAVTERMLRNMVLGDPAGNVDRILDFSTAVTGTQFFVPSQDFLDSLRAGP